MNRRQLAIAVVTVISVVALSSSTIASAEAGSHRKSGRYIHLGSVAPISLSNSGAVLTIEISGSTPRFYFDQSSENSKD